MHPPHNRTLTIRVRTVVLTYPWRSLPSASHPEFPPGRPQGTSPPLSSMSHLAASIVIKLPYSRHPKAFSFASAHARATSSPGREEGTSLVGGTSGGCAKRSALYHMLRPAVQASRSPLRNFSSVTVARPIRTIHLSMSPARHTTSAPSRSHTSFCPTVASRNTCAASSRHARLSTAGTHRRPATRARPNRATGPARSAIR